MSNVDRVIKLQKAVNYQIDTKGQADIKLCDDLENLCDSLTSEEIDELVKRYKFEEEGELEIMDQWAI